MKAIVQDSYGTASVLELRDVDQPKMENHEVMLYVHAAGVNPADWAVMSGLPYIARPVYGLRKPKNRVRGTDVAGHVEAVGTNVTRFRPGDEVFGWCTGSFAEYVAVSDKRSHRSRPISPSNKPQRFPWPASSPSRRCAITAMFEPGRMS